MSKLEDRFFALSAEACCNNEHALSFWLLFNRYTHAIDDIIDDGLEEKPIDPEFVLNTFAMGCTVYGHPFYLANIVKLQQVVFLVTNAYADSVKWERSDRDAQRTIADVLRGAGNEMLFAIALLCGGYEHMRRISGAVREQSWKTHHGKSGEPV